MQSVFDELYKNSLAKCEFKNLISIITTEENIRLAYRNLKKNAGSRTPGTDGKTIADLAKMSEPELIGLVQQKFKWYQPQSVRRKEIPKGNGKTRPLGIPTIMDRLIQQCVLQYPFEMGRLDLLCEDENGDLYIIELKKDSGYDDAYVQTAQYLDWFEKAPISKGKRVYGIICLNSPTQALISKVRNDQRMRLFEYQISYTEIK